MSHQSKPQRRQKAACEMMDSKPTWSLWLDLPTPRWWQKYREWQWAWKGQLQQIRGLLNALPMERSFQRPCLSCVKMAEQMGIGCTERSLSGVLNWMPSNMSWSLWVWITSARHHDLGMFTESPTQVKYWHDSQILVWKVWASSLTCDAQMMSFQTRQCQLKAGKSLSPPSWHSL